MAETPLSISEEQIQAYKKLIELDPPGWEGPIGQIKSEFPDLAKINPLNQEQIDKLPVSEKWAKQCLSLPLHPYMKFKDAERVIKTIKRFFNY